MSYCTKFCTAYKEDNGQKRERMKVKVDRRIRKTRSTLQNGLIDLMREKNIKDITVRELVNFCDVNRSTFYLHYRDIGDLLTQTEDELFGSLNDIVFNRRAGPGEEANQCFLENLFSILSENHDLCTVLIGPNGDLSFVNHVADLIEENCMRLFTPFVDNEDAAYSAAFCVQGCIGLIKRWLQSPAPELPAHMAEITCKILNNAIKTLADDKGISVWPAGCLLAGKAAG